MKLPFVSYSSSNAKRSSAGVYAAVGMIVVAVCFTVCLSFSKVFSVTVAHASSPTVIFLTSGSTWTVPSDWNIANNSIEVIGGGGGGTSAGVQNGGGGGGYAKSTNVSLTPGTSVSYQIGAGGTASTSGGATYICNSTLNCGSIAGTAVVVGANGGGSSLVNGTPSLGGSTIGAVWSYYASRGGSGDTATYRTSGGGGGGGGAGGPTTNGGNGGTEIGGGADGGGGGGAGDGGSSGSVNSAGTGGAGGNNYLATGGGSGGSTNTSGSAGTAGGGGGGGGYAFGAGGKGGAGTEWGSYGAGGGGGGGAGTTGSGGNGGLYGGGGGGAGGTHGGTPGSGAQGIIIITYTPSSGNGGSNAVLPACNSGSSALCGYAWSSTIGWISFNDPNGVVSMDSSGNLTGYAWSSSIGWIQFGGLSGFPTGGGTTAANAQINMSTGALTGWARACSGTVNAFPTQNLPGICSSMTSRTDGWDGWISLSGTGYGVTYNPPTGTFDGYAWGGENIGWMQWNPSVDPVTTNSSGYPPIIQIVANPNPVTTGSPTTLTWSASNNATGCTMSSNPSSTPTGSVATSSSGTLTSGISGPTTFSLTCSNSSGSGSNSVTVATTTTGGPSSGSPTVIMWLDNDPAEALTSVHIHPSDFTALNWDGTAFTNQYPATDTPSCSGNVITDTSGQAIPSWTSGTLPNQALNNSANVITLSNLPAGTYGLSLKCNAQVGGNNVSSSSNPVTITVTNSTIHEQ